MKKRFAYTLLTTVSAAVLLVTQTAPRIRF